MNVIEKKIIDILKQNPYGLTISELSRMSKINRITLSKHLEIMKEKGYLGCRTVGKAKIWYLSEDVNLLEVIYTESQLNKMLKFNDEKNYILGDTKFIILPVELIQILYLELKNWQTIRNIGKRFGILVGTVYKSYSGTERIIREEILEKVIKFYEKMGFGKIEDIKIDIKEVKLTIKIKNLIETEILREIEDVIENKNDIKNYFTEGYFEGLISVLLSIPVKCSEQTNPFQSQETILEIFRI
ncbi:MAG: winged helix-turn-helix domain-containing protein [Nanopusillaceae archaeon]